MLPDDFHPQDELLLAVALNWYAHDLEAAEPTVEAKYHRARTQQRPIGPGIFPQRLFNVLNLIRTNGTLIAVVSPFKVHPSTSPSASRTQNRISIRHSNHYI